MKGISIASFFKIVLRHEYNLGHLLLIRDCLTLFSFTLKWFCSVLFMIPAPFIMAMSAMGGSIGAAVTAGLYFKLRHNRAWKLLVFIFCLETQMHQMKSKIILENTNLHFGVKSKKSQIWVQSYDWESKSRLKFRVKSLEFQSTGLKYQYSCKNKIADPLKQEQQKGIT